MPYEIDHLRDLDRLPATRTTRPDIARSHLSAIFANHDLRLSAGRVDFSHRQAALRDASIGLLRYGAEVEVVAPALDFYIAQLTLDGEIAFQADSFETVLKPGTLFVMNPGIRYRKTWSRDARQLMIKIPRQRLQMHAARRGEGAGPVLFRAAPELCSTADGFVGLIAHICRDLANAEGLCAHGSLRDEMEDLLLSALLVTRGAGDARDDGPDYLRRAERHIRSHAERGVSLPQLAAVSGVSERTLQQAFRRHRGQSPLEFARDLRLDRAREAILSRADVCVTEIALEFGFNHFGRFARSYASRFGEKPSATLRTRLRH